MPLSGLRERLEAAVSGLRELQLLRQRQELLVQAALELQEAAEQEDILLLRKQLNCLRRRDAGLINQLQELDQQISELRLDTEASHDQLETDSRPSSGFYELSDGTSGSLSNSSNSVFSECFCSMADADGRLPPTDELAGCLECDGLAGGLGEDLSCGTVRRTLFAAPPPPALDPAAALAPCDPQSKYHCDLVGRNGSDVYRYPSPLHAVAVQMLSHGAHCRDEGFLKVVDAPVEGLKAESSSLPAPSPAPLVPQSSSWPLSSSSSHIPCHKRLDSYIYSLLQRRTLPIRTTRPRTSISTDPSKGILRQASLCVRQVSGPSLGPGLGILKGSEIKRCWAAGGGPADSAATPSPQTHKSMESKNDEQGTRNGFYGGGVDLVQNGVMMNKSNLAPNQNSAPLSNLLQNDIITGPGSLMKRTSKEPPPSAAFTATLPKDFRELGGPKANSTPKESKQPRYPPDQELPLRSPPISTQPAPAEPELVSVGSSSQSQEEAGGDHAEGGGSHMVNAKDIPAQRHNFKLRKNVKNVKGKSSATTKTSRTSEHSERPERRREKSHHRSSSRSRLLEDGESVYIKVSKGVSSKISQRLPVAIPEGRVLDKHAATALSSGRSGVSKQHLHGNHHSHHHHHHGRDQVVVIAKPKHKRNDYRRLRALMEVPYDEVFRRAQRRQRKEVLSHSAANTYLPSGEQLSGVYHPGGSDSEYSAECASLFHSTIVDTSEDERSNYTANRFGDSESSDEYVEESTTTSDTEESGGGGAGGRTGGMGRGWSQFGAPAARAGGQEMTPSQAKAFVKIKASHNLKRKILRFRSGSLKLMTTV